MHKLAYNKTYNTWFFTYGVSKTVSKTDDKSDDDKSDEPKAGIQPVNVSANSFRWHRNLIVLG